MIKNYPHADLIGKSFNGLTFVSFHSTDAEGYDLYNCDCHCGGKIVTRGKAVRTNRIRTCGCKIEYENLTGRKYSNLTVVESSHARRTDRYLVECVCGVQFEIMGVNLRRGYVRSCGCRRIKGEYETRYHEYKLTNFSTLDQDVTNKVRGLIFRLYRGKINRNVQDVNVIDVGRYYDIETGRTAASAKELDKLMAYFNVNEDNFNNNVAKMHARVKKEVISVGMDGKMSLLDLIDVVIYNILHNQTA